MVVSLFFFLGTKVSAQVRSIMGSALPGTSYSPLSIHCSSQPQVTLNPIPRRPKRKSKSQLSSAKYNASKSKKGKRAVETFQRKLIVFQYMGPDAPRHITRKDDTILVRGMLREIPLTASEEEVREEICAVIRNCPEPDLCNCQPDDFEFIDMSGKHASVPNLKAGMAFSCAAVKTLAGSGSLYIRMVRDLDTEEPDVTVVKVEPGLGDTPQQTSTRGPSPFPEHVRCSALVPTQSIELERAEPPQLGTRFTSVAMPTSTGRLGDHSTATSSSGPSHHSALTTTPGSGCLSATHDQSISSAELGSPGPSGSRSSSVDQQAIRSVLGLTSSQTMNVSSHLTTPTVLPVSHL